MNYKISNYSQEERLSDIEYLLKTRSQKVLKQIQLYYKLMLLILNQFIPTPSHIGKFIFQPNLLK
jgi:hypothetical protein